MRGEHSSRTQLSSSLSLSLFKSSTHGVHNIPSYENFWILHSKMSVPATAYYKFRCLCRRHRNYGERRQSDWNEARKRQQQLGQIVQWCHFGSLTFSLSLSLSLIGRKRQSFLPFPSSIVIASFLFLRRLLLLLLYGILFILLCISQNLSFLFCLDFMSFPVVDVNAAKSNATTTTLSLFFSLTKSHTLWDDLLRVMLRVLLHWLSSFSPSFVSFDLLAVSSLMRDLSEEMIEHKEYKKKKTSQEKTMESTTGKTSKERNDVERKENISSSCSCLSLSVVSLLHSLDTLLPSIPSVCLVYHLDLDVDRVTGVNPLKKKSGQLHPKFTILKPDSVSRTW